jgi:hypothetical protein
MIPINALAILGTGLFITDCYFGEKQDHLIDFQHRVAELKKQDLDVQALLRNSARDSLLGNDPHNEAFRKSWNKKVFSVIFCKLPKDLVKIGSFSLMFSACRLSFSSEMTFQPYSVVIKTVICFFGALSILRMAYIHFREAEKQRVVFEKAREIWVIQNSPKPTAYTSLN